MKKKVSFLLYALPFGFFALYVDWAYGGAWGYLLLYLAMPALAFARERWGGTGLLPGNLLSFAVSAVCIWLVFGTGMEPYFKPFGTMGWLAVLSGASLLLQWLTAKRQWLVLGLLLGAGGILLGGMYWLQWSM